MKFTMGSNQIKSFTAFFSINLAYLCSCIYVDRLFLLKAQGAAYSDFVAESQEITKLTCTSSFQSFKRSSGRKVQRLTGDS